MLSSPNGHSALAETKRNKEVILAITPTEPNTAELDQSSKVIWI